MITPNHCFPCKPSAPTTATPTANCRHEAPAPRNIDLTTAPHREWFAPFSFSRELQRCQEAVSRLHRDILISHGNALSGLTGRVQTPPREWFPGIRGGLTEDEVDAALESFLQSGTDLASTSREPRLPGFAVDEDLLLELGPRNSD